MRYFLIFVTTLLLSSCYDKTPAQIENRASYFYAKDKTVKFVKVSSDISISELAVIYGVSPDEISKLNMISKNAVVKAGYVIEIPINNKGADDNGVLNSDFKVENQDNIKEFSISDYQSRDEHLKKEESYSTNENLKNFQTSYPLNNPKFIWPVFGRVISRYGDTGNSFNDGINIKISEGTNVLAMTDGDVIYAGMEPKVYGNLIILRHSNSLLSAYGHNKELLVSLGDKVKKGTVIAISGKSGYVDSPQVYFSIKKGKTTVDPEKNID
ncbi:M23 family metallopeptidase domain protein [Candidatus Cyrtobacter comes]|uniref:M23 family metallopeptidase domain protein n=1 Tax=Candidatus Cyrtobacter comes TaxID=675776 RepID=A0ABU5L9T1_9RICK|nr:M23 family metallopeptidase [Candidatus Cyrtobacter comes]MDZ5762640.1 M23 family metallopeptidase domain protein [Candidatus Cyrtobacter comes]